MLTIASIVEAEARRDADRGKVARVVSNRLAKKMKLQMDSTVHYVVQRRGGVATSDAERATKSPYNTYYAKGLPPGPIGNPGRASITAAARPTPGPWLYFVAVNPDTGETRFAADAGRAPREREAVQRLVLRAQDAVLRAVPPAGGAAHRAAVLGSPIAHSLSPALHTAAYAALGLDGWGYTAHEVAEDHLARFVAGLGPEWAGLSLTMPLKEAAFAVADEVSPLARRGRGRQHAGAPSRKEGGRPTTPTCTV